MGGGRRLNLSIFVHQELHFLNNTPLDYTLRHKLYVKNVIYIRDKMTHFFHRTTATPDRGIG